MSGMVRWRTKYGEVSFDVPDGVYEPSEDTLLLLDAMEVPEGARVLEVGSGCGVVSLAAARRAELVVATDIRAEAAAATHRNATANALHSKVMVVRCDLASALKPGAAFDIVLFNPPYLPVRDGEETWSGGEKGVDVVLRLVRELPSLLRRGGSAFIVVSSLGRFEEAIRAAEEAGLTAETVAEKKQFFETLLAIKICKSA